MTATTPALPVAITAFGRLRSPWRFFLLRTATSTLSLLLIPLLRACGIPALVALCIAMLALVTASKALAAKGPRHLFVVSADDGSLRARGKFDERSIEGPALARVMAVRRRENGGLGLSLEGIDGEVGLEPADISATRLEALFRLIDAASRGDEAAMRATAADSGLTLRNHKGRVICLVFEKPGMLSVSLAALAVACTVVMIATYALRANFA